MTRTVLLVLRPFLYLLLKALIDQWKADREAEGWIVRILQTNATGGYALRAELAAQQAFDHLFLLGSVPVIWYFWNLDGHAERWEAAPWHLVNTGSEIDTYRVAGTDNCSRAYPATKPYAAVGWLNYDGLYGDPANGKPGLTDAEIIDQYRRWFARRHKLAFPQIISYLNDRFGDAAYFGTSCTQEFAQYPKSFTRFSPRVVNDDDGEIVKQVPALIDGVFAGGFQWGQLFGFADWQKLRDYPIQAPIFHAYASFLADAMRPEDGRVVDNPVSFQWWTLVDKALPGSLGCKVVASIYNWAGRFKFSSFLAGKTLGQATLDTYNDQGNYIPINWLLGDPTITLDADTLARLAANEQGADVTEAAFEAAVTAMQTQIDALKADVAALKGTGGGGGGTAVVILSAKYRQVAAPGTFKDCAAVVQRLVDAGTAFYVYSETAPCLSDPSWQKPKDPYPGVPKELYVEYSKGGGKVPPVTFGQWAQVVL